MINYTYKELFKKASIPKQLIITFDNKTITNNHIYQESFELAESLCSESELRFGCCESSVIKMKIRNEFGSLSGKTLNVSMVLNGNNENPFQFGEYKVDSCELSGDKNYVNITAYDKMFDIINANVVEWYDNLKFPLTIKALRNSFFAYLGITQEKTTLLQDSVIVEKTIDVDEISGLKVISAICELNGVFGHINRDGEFVYVSLLPNAEIAEAYTKYVSCEYEEFITSPIAKVQIRQEEGDIGAISGTGDNTYIVNDNFLVYGKSSSDLSVIADRLLEKINGISYMPFRATIQGNPCIEVGDLINVSAKTQEVKSYMLERTIKGVQFLKDDFESKGIYEYSENVNSANKETRQLKGKINKLTRTVEETKLEIADVEEGLSNEIKQTASELTARIEQVAKDTLGEITFYSTDKVPTLENYPANEWSVPVYPSETIYPSNSKVWVYTKEQYQEHLGAVAYQTGTEYSYKFMLNSDDNMYWKLIENTDTSYLLNKVAELEITTDEITAEVAKTEQELQTNYYTKKEADSKISQTAETITAEITAFSERIEDEYYTSEQTDTKIAATTENIALQIESIRNIVADNEFYSTDKVPTLENYPANEWSVPVYPSETIYPSNSKVWVYTKEQYQEHLGAVIYASNNSKTYKYWESESGYAFKEMSDADVSYYMERFAGIDISLDGITYEVGSLEQKMVGEYATKEETKSTINQTSKSILMEVEGTYTTKSENKEQVAEIDGKLELKLNTKDLVSELNLSADDINITGDRFSLDSKGTKISKEGKIITNDLQVTGGNIDIDASSNTESFKGVKIRTTYNSDNYGEMYASSSGAIIELKSSKHEAVLFENAFQIFGRSGTMSYPKFWADASASSSTEFDGKANIFIDGDAWLYGRLTANGTGHSYVKGSFTIGGSGGKDDYKAWVAGNAYIAGNLGCSGTKNRVVETNNYGDVLLNAYETASPMFGDVGTGMLNENCECIVVIDDIFAETIDETADYNVFLQKYGAGDLWVDEIQKSYFVVKGTVANIKFAWEIKAKQRDYAMYRLENQVTNNFATEYIDSDYISQNQYETAKDENITVSEAEIVDFEDTSEYETVIFENTTKYEL